jgi:hypothetical protein
VQGVAVSRQSCLRQVYLELEQVGWHVTCPPIREATTKSPPDSTPSTTSDSKA